MTRSIETSQPWAELERLARVCATVDPIGPGWYTYADLSKHMEPCDARLVERLTATSVLELITAARTNSVGTSACASEQKHQAVSAEDVARVIEPEGWRLFDQEVQDCKRWGADLNPPPKPDRFGTTAASLRKANAILALLPTPTKGNDAGVVGDLVERLRAEVEDQHLLPGNLIRDSLEALAKYATQGTGGA